MPFHILVDTDSAQTLTNKTFSGGTITGASITATSAALTSAVLAGTITGTYTLGGTPTISSILLLTGGRIIFPATQVPSADPNTLDDYEEGQFTPSLGGNATYTSRSGFYVKIGKLVFFNCNMIVNVIGTGSTGTISGLPFTSGDASSSVAVSGVAALATAVVSVNATVPVATTTIVVAGRSAANAAENVAVIFGNGTSVIITGMYTA